MTIIDPIDIINTADIIYIDTEYYFMGRITNQEAKKFFLNSPDRNKLVFSTKYKYLEDNSKFTILWITQL